MTEAVSTLLDLIDRQAGELLRSICDRPLDAYVRLRVLVLELEDRLDAAPVPLQPEIAMAIATIKDSAFRIAMGGQGLGANDAREAITEQLTLLRANLAA